MQRSEVVQFFVKALGIYILWYFVYDLWMLPDGRVDAWLSEHIVVVSAGLLSGMGFDAYASGRIVGLLGANMLEIVNGCNGIEVLGLFVGFVVAYPGRTVNRVLFVPIGMLVLYVTNVVRIVVLAITQLHAPGIFDITHDYSTTAIFYAVVFVMWVVWVNFGARDFLGGRGEGGQGVGASDVGSSNAGGAVLGGAAAHGVNPAPGRSTSAGETV